MARYEVFNRDNFKCQNVGCCNPDAPLTIHHIKAQRNEGQNVPKNMVTICDICHKRYEKARGPLTFSKSAAHLHKRLRGHTFRLHRASDDRAQWKKIKKFLKRFRKVLRQEGFQLTLEEYIDQKDVDLDLRQIILTVSRQRKF